MEWLEELLRSRTFKRRLKEAALITYETGHESGFLVTKKGKKLFYEKVKEGLCDEIDLTSTAIVANWTGYEVEGGVHFHPNAMGVIAPSYPDLSPVTWTRVKEMIKPPCAKWLIVGQVRSDKTVALLAVKPKGVLFYDEISEYEDYEIPLYGDQGSINKILEEFGFEVKLVYLPRLLR